MKAAIDEFATHGLAGARVDRIAEQASANKRSIYLHFGTKEELFDRVVGDCMAELAAAVVVDASDLPRYAGALFEQLEKRPHVRRLYLWAGLERRQPVEAEVAEYRRHGGRTRDQRVHRVLVARSPARGRVPRTQSRNPGRCREPRPPSAQD